MGKTEYSGPRGNYIGVVDRLGFDGYSGEMSEINKISCRCPDHTANWGAVYLEGEELILNCDDGPAIEYESGGKEWWRNNLLHREDGPAVECSAGNQYWLFGKRVKKKNYKKLILQMKMTRIIET